MRTCSCTRAAHAAILGVFLVMTASSNAQQTASAALPEAPSAHEMANAQQGGSGAQQGEESTANAQTVTSKSTVAPAASANAEQAHLDPQTKRILGIFPNFRAVSADTHLPPQPTKEKFFTASQDSFDYSAFVLPLALAAEGEVTTATPEFHGGAPGFARYFWHTFVDQTSENYMVEFIVPSLTHEDTRYYTLGKTGGSGAKRVGYALSRAVITRTDAGKKSFNFSEVVGAGAAAGLSNLYYPQPERTFSNTGTRWATNVGIDAGTFILREFWPDFNHWVFHGHAGETPAP